MQAIGRALEAAGQTLALVGSRLAERPAPRARKSGAQAQLLKPLSDARREVAARLGTDGWRTLDRSMVLILRRLAFKEPDAQRLAEFLVECTGMDALDALSGPTGQDHPGISEGKRKSLEFLVQATLEASRPQGSRAFEALALEATVDLWLLDPSMGARTGSAMDVLRQFGQTIRETATNDAQADITRLGLALCTSSVIHLWRYIESLPAAHQEACSWTAPDADLNPFEPARP